MSRTNEGAIYMPRQAARGLVVTLIDNAINEFSDKVGKRNGFLAFEKEYLDELKRIREELAVRYHLQ